MCSICHLHSTAMEQAIHTEHHCKSSTAIKHKHSTYSTTVHHPHCSSSTHSTTVHHPHCSSSTHSTTVCYSHISSTHSNTASHPHTTQQQDIHTISHPHTSLQKVIHTHTPMSNCGVTGSYPCLLGDRIISMPSCEWTRSPLEWQDHIHV